MSSKRQPKYVAPPPYLYFLDFTVPHLQQVAPALDEPRIKELMDELPEGVEMEMREAALEVWKTYLESEGVWTGKKCNLTQAMQNKGRAWLTDVLEGQLGAAVYDSETDYELAEAVCANCLDGELDWRELDLEL